MELRRPAMAPLEAGWLRRFVTPPSPRNTPEQWPATTVSNLRIGLYTDYHDVKVDV